MAKPQGSVLFIPHGGGPLPLLGDPLHEKLVDFLSAPPGLDPRPDAIILISAHWEESIVKVTTAEQPQLYYDYYGFPEESYAITYPAPGSPELANRIVKHLNENGIEAQGDEDRGFDHGMFVPLKLMVPDATIPVVQISMLHSLDAAAHIQLGEVLSPFRFENIFILGSGFTFHNLRAMFRSNGQDPQNEAFEYWLRSVMTSELSYEERKEKLTGWESAPGARYCQPREDHLLPLLVCLGAGQDKAELIFNDKVVNKRTSGYFWSGSDIND